MAAAAALLADARDVTLLAHVQPDADALGSVLALGIALRRRGATVRVSFADPDVMPESLRPLDVLGLFVPAAQVPAVPDVLVACDTASVGRLGGLADRVPAARATLLVDHHASNDGFGTHQVVDPSAEATVVLVHRILTALGTPIDEAIANCLYVGLVTDTVGFRTAGPGAHRLAATLLEAGVQVEPLIRPITDTHPFAWLGALADVLRDAVLDLCAAGGHGLVHTIVPAELIARFRFEEIDSVIDQIRCAAEAEVAAVLKQVGPRRWTVSLRAKGTVDVAAVAVALGGGGHRNAAGLTWDGEPGDLLDALRAALDAAAPTGLAGHRSISGPDR
ncbi:DHH family phosphoesterase [Pseudonocardia asaccharolytica]|uniref:DHH family phosphoesterase n=1 Tax=Pseudonocardia asaccharolytica TaxID=54010 RepID=UPI000686C4E4|nr:DHH family phosphoesterase [Pseudonocardia asaccharolytica]